MVKNLSANAEDSCCIPGLGRPLEEGNGDPLQCSCPENSIDRGLQSMRSQSVGHDWETK